MTQFHFPIIRTINDVLPYIQGRDEFVVVERPYGKVINYVVQLKESFEGNDYAAAIRKECRGLVFNNAGLLVSRPFQKFFNVGEREDTFFDNLDLDVPHVVMEKLDGSMVRPIRNEHGIWCMGTRMGITDIGLQADMFIGHRNRKQYDSFFDFCEIAGITPIFEWCTNQNRIVVSHPQDRLVLTAMRRTFIGTYLSDVELCNYANGYGLHEVVNVYDDHNVGSVLETVQDENKSLEGYVVRWNNGMMVKVKLDWYVDVHKAKEAIQREKYIIEMILNRNIDDVKAKLQEDDLRRVEDFEDKFNEGFVKRAGELSAYYEHVRNTYPTKKDYALAPCTPEMEVWKPLVFAMWNGKIKHLLKGLITTILSRTKSQPDIDANRWIWYGAKYDYNGVVGE